MMIGGRGGAGEGLCVWTVGRFLAVGRALNGDAEKPELTCRDYVPETRRREWNAPFSYKKVRSSAVASRPRSKN